MPFLKSLRTRATRPVMSFLLIAALLIPVAKVLIAYAAGNDASGAPLLIDNSGAVGCYLGFIEGPLVADPTYGTVIKPRISANGTTGKDSSPVMWPAGYQARWSGAEIEVYDQAGHFVVRTGTSVHLDGGYQDGVWQACPGRAWGYELH